MESDSSFHWNSLEQLCPSAFLGAGVLLLGHAAVMSIQAFTTMTAPVDVFAPVGHLLALVGLVGLSPLVTDRNPLVTRIGAVLASVIGVGWAVVTLSIVARAVGTFPQQLETLFGILSIVVLVSTILPYVLFGVVTLRSETVSRTLGFLLLGPAALLVVLLGDILIRGATSLDGAIIGSGLALSMLAVGFALRTTETRVERRSMDGDIIPR